MNRVVLAVSALIFGLASVGCGVQNTFEASCQQITDCVYDPSRNSESAIEWEQACFDNMVDDHIAASDVGCGDEFVSFISCANKYNECFESYDEEGVWIMGFDQVCNENADAYTDCLQDN